MMILEKITVGIMGVNCYITGDKDEVFIIDPGGNADKIYSVLNTHGFHAKYIVLTHCHFDHILAADELKKRTGAQITVCAKEAANLADSNVNMTGRFTRTPLSLCGDVCVSESNTLTSGKFVFRVIETPGHTSGGMCLYCAEEKILFSGDTLFCGSIGRSDFPTGNQAVLVHSIQEKLLTLPKDVHVYPGHETDTTIGFEKLNNPYLQQKGE